MTDDGTGAQRPSWEGFPPYPPQPGQDGGGYDPPTAPQFPVVPPEDLTAPVPIVGGGAVAAAAAENEPGRRSHRAEAAPRDSRRYLAAGAVAALAVIGAAFVILNLDGSDGSGVAGTGTVVAPSLPAVVPTTSTSAPPSASASASASESASASASPTESVVQPGVTASPRPSGAGSGGPDEADLTEPAPVVKGVKQPVVVLNNTSIVGLAARVAADIEAEGWTVPETANWRGSTIPGTTIYYQPGVENRASAKLFARQFDVVTDVRPALPGMESVLVLVLAADAA